MIKLETLRVFVIVAEAGNIKDASDVLGRTASAISMTLKQLEEEVGGPLFQTDRKNSLTALGSFMLDVGARQIASYDRAMAKIYDYSDNKTGDLPIASVPSFAAYILPKLIPEFIQTRPNVSIDIVDMNSRQVRRRIENSEADVGFLGEIRSTSQLDFTPLFRDRFKIICSAQTPLCRLNRAVEWSDLVGVSLIRNEASDSIQSEAYQNIARLARFNVPNVVSLMAMVKAGLGVTLLPSLFTFDRPDGVEVLELLDSNLSRVVGMVVRRERAHSPLVDAFIEHAQNEMPKQRGELRLYEP